LVQNILGEGKISDTWKYIDQIKDVQSMIAGKITELKNAKKDLEDKKKETEQARAELVSLKSRLADQKKIVEDTSRQKNALLKQTKNQESNYKKILAQKIALKDSFEKEVRDFESQLKFILDPSTLPSGAVFNWPLDNIFITQLFGATVDAKRLYVSGSHNGVDFAASIGTPVKAMLSGTVVGTGDTDLTCPGASFGRWVLIKHNNGLSSLYAHFSLIKVSAGQSVSTGEIIGYSGNTGYTTGPHLHVTVYAASAVQIQNRPSKSCGGRTYTMPIAAINAYLDPMLYLPRYVASR
jgi:murein DD-endopeptidase MepM/ murein hydrolase activator NlpD